MESSRPPSPASAEKIAEFAFSLVKNPKKPLELQQKIFILVNANFALDWDKNIFVINNYHQLLERYKLKNFQDFDKSIELVLKQVNKRVGTFSGGKRLADNFVTYQSPKNSFRHRTEEQYYYSSSLRNLNPHYDLSTFIDRVVKSMLIDEIIKKIITDQNLDPQCYKPLQPKVSQSIGSSNFARDYSVVIGKNIFQPHPYLLEKLGHLQDPDLFLKKRESFFADFQSSKESELEIKRELPFILEGGNVIECKNKNGENILLVAVSDATLIDRQGDDKFIGAYILNGDSFVEVDKENDLGIAIAKFGESQGCKVIMLDRNLQDHSLASIYHADMFCNVAKLYSENGVRNILFIPEASEKVITDETEEELVQNFGEENIVRFCEADRKNLFSNFIQFGNLLVMSSDKISPELIHRLNEIGFSVALPPISLDLVNDLTDGIRCHTFPRFPRFEQLDKSQKTAASSRDLSS